MKNNHKSNNHGSEDTAIPERITAKQQLQEEEREHIAGQNINKLELFGEEEKVDGMMPSTVELCGWHLRWWSKMDRLLHWLRAELG